MGSCTYLEGLGDMGFGYGHETLIEHVNLNGKTQTSPQSTP